MSATIETANAIELINASVEKFHSYESPIDFSALAISSIYSLQALPLRIEGGKNYRLPEAEESELTDAA